LRLSTKRRASSASRTTCQASWATTDAEPGGASTHPGVAEPHGWSPATGHRRSDRDDGSLAARRLPLFLVASIFFARPNDLRPLKIAAVDDDAELPSQLVAPNDALGYDDDCPSSNPGERARSAKRSRYLPNTSAISSHASTTCSRLRLPRLCSSRESAATSTIVRLTGARASKNRIRPRHEGGLRQEGEQAAPDAPQSNAA
jgi:hypothetical protein